MKICERFLKMRTNGKGIFIGIFLMFSLLIMGGASAAEYSVCSSGCDYSSIQDAVGASINGDTINVLAGTYYENVDVTKSLNLFGAGKESTVIIALNSNDNVIEITADNVNLSGFKLAGATTSSGLFIYQSNGGKITGNHMTGNQYGIFLKESERNLIYNNDVTYNPGLGIYLYYGTNNTVTNNRASNNYDGITLEYSDCNNIALNTMVDNSEYGMYIWSCCNNTVNNNYFENEYNACFDGEVKANEWSVLGSGNYWAAPDGSGFSETCMDANRDGICDSSFSLQVNNVDFSPLALKASASKGEILYVVYDAANAENDIWDAEPKYRMEQAGYTVVPMSFTDVSPSLDLTGYDLVYWREFTGFAEDQYADHMIDKVVEYGVPLMTSSPTFAYKWGLANSTHPNFYGIEEWVTDELTIDIIDPAHIIFGDIYGGITPVYRTNIYDDYWISLLSEGSTLSPEAMVLAYAEDENLIDEPSIIEFPPGSTQPNQANGHLPPTAPFIHLGMGGQVPDINPYTSEVYGDMANDHENFWDIFINAVDYLTDNPSCSMSFSDVTQSHWAYSYIEYLFCNGIVNGYPDGSFQPGNSITRGQFAKMIVNANGIPEYHPATPTFSDVPSDHWSYGYVEAAVQAGIISGYTDGTFRPSNQVTRAQISAMIARSKGWTYSGGLEDFTDVAPSHWAYDNIMSMKEMGIIGGYTDGTFLPANQATRGQNSKMIANMMQTPS